MWEWAEKGAHVLHAMASACGWVEPGGTDESGLVRARVATSPSPTVPKDHGAASASVLCLLLRQTWGKSSPPAHSTVRRSRGQFWEF